jgi:alpha-L-fucosidase 2
MNNKPYLIALLICFCNCLSSYGQSDKILWYHQPASYFEESLVLGNGKMGASVFGGVASDKIFFNDATLWSGEPVSANMAPEAYKNVPLVREALKKDNYRQADILNRKIQGKFAESYAPLGTLYIDFKHAEAYKNYRRELDISQAVSKLSYEADGAVYAREYFISHPDKVMVIHLTSSKKEAINCTIRFESLLKYYSSGTSGILSINGYAPYHTEPDYRGNIPNAIAFDEKRGTRFTSLFQLKNKDGKVLHTDSTIELSACSEAFLFVSVATSFNGYDKNPATEGLDNSALAIKQLNNASRKSYNELKRAHLNDYQSFYKRVSLTLGATTAPDLPTDERLMRYAKGAEDKNLEILYFQYGRYLLISSSRTPGVPANLQGIWNPYMRPPWSSNYTLNINAQENYWLAESANLSELHRPLLSFIENLASTGKATARTFYGVGGWAACHNSDIWAMSNPVGDFGKGDPNWANWNMGGVWLSTHLWEHYLFSRDLQFLKTKGYPLIKGAVLFCLDWMVQDDKGNWITSPSTSPENRYVTPDGYKGATLYGATADIAMIRELFQAFIGASAALSIQDDFVNKVVAVSKKLHPYSIGKKGNLQEWYYDWEDEEPKHRHQSHLFGLYPGHQILPSTTPQLAQASRTSLEIKGDETTGWSKGWRINLWARLWEGNRAYKMYRELLRYVAPSGIKTNYGSGGGTYPNLFDAHPPFQIDGNFGGAAAVIEMLMQSTENRIYLLPALPDAWENGAVKGICARGGFELSLEWKNKKLITTAVFAKSGGKTTLVNGDKQKTLALTKGQRIIINW